MDRDVIFTVEFRNFLRHEGVKSVRLPPRSPNLNAYAERFVRTIKENCLNRIDLTVLASNHEGMPNVFLESLATGVPVVVTNILDNRMLVPHGEMGFFVPSGDLEQLDE